MAKFIASRRQRPLAQQKRQQILTPPPSITASMAEADGIGAAPGIGLGMIGSTAFAQGHAGPDGPAVAPAIGAALWSEPGEADGTASSAAIATGPGAIPNQADAIGAAVWSNPATASGTGAASGASFVPFVQFKLGWGEPRCYDPTKLNHPKIDPIKEALAERERIRAERAATAKARFNAAYTDAWKRVRAEKGAKSDALRSLMHLLGPHRDSQVDHAPLVEILELAREARSPTEINHVKRRAQRLLQLFERMKAAG